MTETTTRPASPCIQLCRLAPDTQRCLGCGRRLDEIARWGGMDEAEREAVWRRLEAERITNG
ncbi:DUF1289 domain-containing protein [Halomonas ramblicola]|uniref:DUF1289 domain-containing protein n=1 Tax=Halomonas ramblicola TaxID=747349 RepID=UPI0025B611AE|nr:DUF1289 domain-containing protein [Halomonas ramblicola]MDN3521894.1 DUF1289 domain-containing protein [Halomonas ramblicola]